MQRHDPIEPDLITRRNLEKMMMMTTDAMKALINNCILLFTLI